MTYTEFHIGGELPVRRIGFGSMHLTGPGFWGMPADPDAARSLLRLAVGLGVNHIDTADAYGPATVEQLIHQALHPYPDDLVVATKGGFARPGPDQWKALGRPEYLRQCLEMSLRRLGTDHIDLYYLHRIDPAIPLADQVGTLAQLRDEGKIRHIGLSKVTVEQIRAASRETTIAAVQNRYNPEDRQSEDVLRHCETHKIAFVPYAPVGAGKLENLRIAAAERGVTEPAAAPLALAWLLQHSAVTLPIPGTTKTTHLRDNLTADRIELTPNDIDAISHTYQTPA